MTSNDISYSDNPEEYAGKSATGPQQTALARARALDLDLALDVNALRDLRAKLDALIIKADEAGMSVTGDRVQCARGHLDELIKLVTA